MFSKVVEPIKCVDKEQKGVNIGRFFLGMIGRTSYGHKTQCTFAYFTDTPEQMTPEYRNELIDDLDAYSVSLLQIKGFTLTFFNLTYLDNSGEQIHDEWAPRPIGDVGIVTGTLVESDSPSTTPVLL